MAGNYASQTLNINVEGITPLIYKAGGLRPGGYGFISGGYGGGVEQDEYFELLYFRGFMDGVMRVNEQLAKDLCGEINAHLVEHFDVPPADVPFAWNGVPL